MMQLPPAPISNSSPLHQHHRRGLYFRQPAVRHFSAAVNGLNSHAHALKHFELFFSSVDSRLPPNFLAVQATKSSKKEKVEFFYSRLKNIKNHLHSVIGLFVKRLDLQLLSEDFLCNRHAHHRILCVIIRADLACIIRREDSSAHHNLAGFSRFAHLFPQKFNCVFHVGHSRCHQGAQSHQLNVFFKDSLNDFFRRHIFPKSITV